MTLHLDGIPANSTLYIPFTTYDGATGASETCSGLAVTDIEIYKNGSTTQRSSDNGYALLDTDGIDFDSITGLNGFSVDLSDNSDAGFYSVGGFYWVVVSSITADAVTVNFIAATFRIVAAESIAGKPKVDVDGFGGSAGTFASGIPEVKVASLAANAITATAINADAITAAKIADAAIDRATFAADTGLQAVRSNTAQAGAATTVTLDASASAVDDFYKGDAVYLTGGTGVGQYRICTGYVGATKVATVTPAWATNPDNTSTFAVLPHGMVDLKAILGVAVSTSTAQLGVNVVNNAGSAITAASGIQEVKVASIAANAITATAIATDAIDADAIAADAVSEIQSGLATAAALTAVDDFVDTEVAAIKAKTDQLTFTSANKIDANVLALNGDATSAANIAKTTRAIARGTADAGASTTSIPTSAFTPAGAAADQFKGRIITFDADTATTALRGQSTDITASSNNAAPTLTVTALTNAPQSGDTFSVT